MISVLVDLEVLLDTRMGVALSLDAKALEKWGTAWQNRLYDQNPDGRYGLDYTHEEFKQAFANRDASVIGKSIPTRLMWDIPKLVADWQRHRVPNFVTPVFKLVVNTYPFEFQGEALEALKYGLDQYLTEGDGIEVIVRDPVSFLPTELRKNYSIVIFDDFERWANENFKHLEDNPIPNVLVVGKRWCANEPEDNLGMGALEMFEYFEIPSSALMFFRFFGMDWFSYHFPKLPPAEKQNPASG